MRHPAAARLAWAVCALSLTLTALSYLLIALSLSLSTPVFDYWPEATVIAVAYSVIGAIIASRLLANPLGWFFCAAALFAALAHFCSEYAIYTLLAQPDSLPAGEALAWLAS